MKKIFVFLTAGFIPIVTMFFSADAQSSKLGFEYYAKNDGQSFKIKDLNYFKILIDTVTEAAPSNNAVADLSAISKKAIKNFKVAFGKTEAVTWHQLSNGFTAHFMVNNILNRSYYDKKGNWLYSMQCYDEKKLPADVRKIVKSTYYDYSIFGVQEIRVDDKIIYLVHLKDEAGFKTIRVCEGEMQELESLKNNL